MDTLKGIEFIIALVLVGLAALGIFPWWFAAFWAWMFICTAPRFACWISNL